MRAPFSRAAEGVRLPDGNPNLSTTLAVTQKFLLATSASGTIDAVVLPNLATNAFSSRGSISSATSALLSLADTSLTNDTAKVPVTASANGVGTPVQALAAQYSKYRIAAYGVRVRMNQGLSVNGEITVAVMPLKGLAPTLTGNTPLIAQGASGTNVAIGSYWGAAGPRGDLTNVLDSLGLPYSGSGNTALVDLDKLVNTPCHAVASAAQVAQRGLHVRGVPFEASARDYLSMTYGAHGTDSVDVSTVVGTAAGSTYAVQQYGVDMSCYRVGGTESVIIGGQYFPVSQFVGTVEIIYHVEAIMNPSYSLLARSTSTVPRVLPHQNLDSQLATLHRVPRVSFADVVQTTGDAMLGEVEGRAAAGAASAVSSLGGMLGRLLVAGA